LGLGEKDRPRLLKECYQPRRCDQCCDEWDDLRITSERINGADPIAFGYDNDNLLTSAGAVSYTRRADDGLLLAATLGSTATAFDYNDFGELIDEETTRGGTPLYHAAYTRDAGGRIATKTETIGGITTTDAYTYDVAGRLESVTRNGSPLASYTYDANGNRTSITTSSGTISATYDDQDRILTFGSRTYTHTAHGDVQSWTDASGTTTLTYDVQGNLRAVNVPNGDVVEYIVGSLVETSPSRSRDHDRAPARGHCRRVRPGRRRRSGRTLPQCPRANRPVARAERLSRRCGGNS
jgi:YD repeat-containing protein